MSKEAITDDYLYIKKLFGKWAPFYDTFSWFLSGVRDKVVGFIEAEKGSKILDVATGASAGSSPGSKTTSSSSLTTTTVVAVSSLTSLASAGRSGVAFGSSLGTFFLIGVSSVFLEPDKPPKRVLKKL